MNTTKRQIPPTGKEGGLRRKGRLAAMAVALTALAIPATAQAHVFLEQTEAPAAGFPILNWVVPHGCDGSATTSVTVRFPKSVPSVTPEVVPGWELSTKEGPKDRTELFGETVTEGISQVTWTAQDDPLPDPYLMRFGAEVALPDSEGETLYFPTIQKCEQGQTAWIQIPAEGETEEDLEEPAPALTLTAPEGGHGEMEDAPSTEEAEHGETEDAAAAEEAGDEDDGDFASQGLGIAALAVGGAGVLLGGAGLLRRK